MGLQKRFVEQAEKDLGLKEELNVQPVSCVLLCASGVTASDTADAVGLTPGF
jgi:predicted metal-binding protein